MWSVTTNILYREFHRGKYVRDGAPFFEDYRGAQRRLAIDTLRLYELNDFLTICEENCSITISQNGGVIKTETRSVHAALLRIVYVPHHEAMALWIRGF